MNRRLIAWVVVILLLLPFLIMIFSGCSANEQPVADTVPQEIIPVETTAGETYDIETVYSECAIVNIAVGEDGAYCLMAEISVDMFDGEPIGVVICDPTLLAFQVSERFDNGIYVFSMNEGNEIVERIGKIRDKMADAGNAELAGELQEILDSFGLAGPYCGEST